MSLANPPRPGMTSRAHSGLFDVDPKEIEVVEVGREASCPVLMTNQPSPDPADKLSSYAYHGLAGFEAANVCCIVDQFMIKELLEL